MSTNVERLKKLKELALRGVGGEREQAIALLEKLSKKYGVASADLDETIKKDFRFTFHGKVEKKLLVQIAYKVTNETGGVYSLRYTYSGRKCRTACEITCTEAEKLEIEYLFDFYKMLWEKEMDAFLSAFIQKHRLFGELKEGEEGEELTPEELEKMYALMKGMSDDRPLLAITDGRN